MARSWARYPGGKTKVAEMLLGFMPVDTVEYRECFVGGGGVYFGLSPTRVKKRWINDVNPHLISVYRALTERADEFLALCRMIPPMQPGESEVATKGTGKKYNERLGQVFAKFAAGNSFCSDSLLDQAIRYFFINRTVWAGRVNYDPEFASRMYYSNPTGWNIVGREGYLETIVRHMSGTRITCGDYEQLLQEDGERVWIYCDPPYVVDTHLNKGSKLYQYGFTMDEHERFVDACKRTKHRVLISYDDVPEVHNWFKGFEIQKKTWTHCGTTLEKKRAGNELVIANYSLQPEGPSAVDMFLTDAA